MLLCLTTAALVVAMILHELYRRRKSAQEEGLAVVCHLAKFPKLVDGGDELCVQMMIQHRISPNTLRHPKANWTPFLSACFGGSLRVIQYMLDQGAEKTQTNSDGDGPLYIAVYGIVDRLLVAFGPVRSQEVQLGVLIIDCLINYGCDVNSVNCYGYTPLHWAAAKGELWLVDHLLKRGANPCCRTTLSGALPSTCASEFKYEQVKVILHQAEESYFKSC